MSTAFLRRLPSVALCTLWVCVALGSSLPVAHAQIVGRIAARGVVKRNANQEIDQRGQPTWVVYDADGKQTALPCGQPNSTISTQVMSADEYASWLHGVAVADAEPDTRKIDESAYTGVKCQAPADIYGPAGLHNAANVFPLLPTTHTVVVHDPGGAATPCSDIIRFQSPLPPDAQALDSGVQSVLMSTDTGLVLCAAQGTIGYETAFMYGGEQIPSSNDQPPSTCRVPAPPPPPPGSAQVVMSQADNDIWSFINCSPGNMAAPTPGTPTQTQIMVWSPVFGAELDMSNYEAIRTATTGGTGLYSLYYTTLPPFSFNFNVNARLAFDSFNPRMGSSHYFYMTGKGTAGSSSAVTFANFPVEITMVHVRATLGNPSGFSNIINPATLVGVTYTNLDLAANATTYSPTANGDGDIGLVQQISAPDLRDTDLFVYRVADGKLIGSRWGLSSNEIGWGVTPKVNGGYARFEVSALVRGPASRWTSVVRDAFNPATTEPARLDPDGKVVRPAQFGIEVDYPEGTEGRNAYLREGDLVKVVLVNRGTGYVGTRLAKLARGSSGLPALVSVDGQGGATAPAAGGPALEFKMRPPNLKVRVQREYTVDKGATKSAEARSYVIGFEGAGLSSDKIITVDTEWYDADGSALPDDLPGFTGRLAKTVLPAEAGPGGGVTLPNGQAAPVVLKGIDCGDECSVDQLGMFSITPGRHTHVVRLPEAQIDTSHFYVHIDAQPTERHSFSGRVDPGGPRFDVNSVCYRNCVDAACTQTEWSCIARSGAGTGPLEQRPSTYVPFLAPKYNKEVTEAAQKYASANHLAKPEPAYDWHYRPEMQFSIFDLDVKELTTRDEHGTEQDALVSAALPGAGNGVVQLIYSLTDPDVDALPGFTTDPTHPRTLVFTLGKQEVAAQYDSSTQTVQFATPKAVDQLQSDDYLTIRLVQKGDEGNVLWEYGFEPIKVTVEGGVTQLNGGEQARAMAVLDKSDGFKEMQAKWSIKPDPLRPACDATINAGGMIAVAPDSDDGWLTIRAEDPNDPLVFKEENLQIGCPTCQGGGGNSFPGTAHLDAHSIDAVFGLGRASQGTDAGGIYLRVHDMPDDVYSPKLLVLSTLDLKVKSIFSANGTLRQVSAPESFVDVKWDQSPDLDGGTGESGPDAGAPEIIGPSAYEVRYYEPLAPGTEPETTGYWKVTGAPLVVWRVENPNPEQPDSGVLRLTEKRDGNTILYEYHWDHDANDWILDAGNETTEKDLTETRVQTPTGTERKVRVVSQGSSGVASVKDEIYRSILGTSNGPDAGVQNGEKLVREVLDPENDALSTVTEYYQDTDHPGSYGKVLSISRPDGSWVAYQYDDYGRITSEKRPWLDAPFMAPESECQVIVWDYTPVSALDVLFTPMDAESAQPRTVSEYVQGTLVAETFYLYQRSVLGDRTVTEERCTNQSSCSFGSAANLRTITHYYPPHLDQAYNGRVQTIQHPDGQLDTYTYDYGRYNAGTFFHEPGPAVLQTVVHGTVESPEGIAFKSTRELSITDERGRAVREETDVCTGGFQYSPVSWTMRAYDEHGHVTLTTHSSGEYEDAHWSRAEDSSTDARGIPTIYSRDDLQRVLISQHAGISTSYSYDADGRELTATRGGGSQSLSSSKHYDLSGRLRSSTDESGLTTAYDYPSSGLQTSVTHPGSFTEITDRFLDGRRRSVTGTSVVQQFFTYSVNGDGTRVTEVRLASAGSPVFERTVTDMAGRTIRVERPAFGGALAVSETLYNSQGQAVRTRTTGLADMLYEYDALGRAFRSGLDVDNDGQLGLQGLDRVSETEDSFSSGPEDPTSPQGGTNAWWHETQQRVYASPTSGAATVVATSRTRLTGFDGSFVAEQVSADLQGNQTRTSVYIDRPARTETRTTDVPDSNQDAVAYSIDGRLRTSTSPTGVTTTYDYDGLGRVFRVTDLRTGASLTNYDPTTGRVTSVVDAANNSTTLDYDATTGRKKSEKNALGKFTYFEYNPRGQVVHTWGDVPYPVEYVYDDYGRQTQMRTYRSTSLNFSTSVWPSGATNGDATTWVNEEATGLLLQKQDATERGPQYTYDIAGHLKTRTWARSKAGGGALVTAYGYDPDTGELRTVDYNDATPDVTYTYDRLGRQNVITDEMGSRTRGYNPTTLQLATETMIGLTPGVLAYNYDATLVKGRPTGITFGPTYGATYGYESTGRMNSVSYAVNGATGAATYTYVPNSDLLGGLTTLTGQATSYGYELHRNLRTQVQNKSAGTTVSQYDYLYDAIGRRGSVQYSGSQFPSANFSLWNYDDRDELIGSGRFTGTNLNVTTTPVAGQQGRSFTYDPIGNRTSGSAGTAAPVAFSANSLNEYATINGAAQIYDLDGNLAADATRTFAYDGENQVAQVAPVLPVNGSKRLTFAYDYLGRRVKKTVETFSGASWAISDTRSWVYSGWNKVQETTVLAGFAATTKDFVWGLDLSQGIGGAGGIGGLLASVASTDTDGARLFTYDGNGNVSELLLTNGVVDAHYEYDAFGNGVAQAGAHPAANNYRFSTKYLDLEDSLYYYGYRYYDPVPGRWVNRDPIGERGGIALYGFAGNSPTSAYDALGLDPDPATQSALTLAANDVGLLSEPPEGAPSDKIVVIAVKNGTGLSIVTPTSCDCGSTDGPTILSVQCIQDYVGAAKSAGAAVVAYVPNVTYSQTSFGTKVAEWSGADRSYESGSVDGSDLGHCTSGNCIKDPSVISAAQAAVIFKQAYEWGSVLKGAASAGFKAIKDRLLKRASERADKKIAGIVVDKAVEGAEKATARGLSEEANFAQRTFREEFSSDGRKELTKVAGRPIRTMDDLVKAIKGGLDPGKIPVNYIVRDGKTLILNTRSALALERAGVPRSAWNAVNRTGDTFFEGLLSAQLSRAKLGSEGIPFVIMQP